MAKTITVQADINANIDKVWECWNNPKHISGWAFASNDWEAVPVNNDLKVGGKFNTRMQAKDGSQGFDFTGTYTAVKENELIEYKMDDPPSQSASVGHSKRHVKIIFKKIPEGVRVIETFDPDDQNSVEIQRTGWQAILDNFKKYVEKH